MNSEPSYYERVTNILERTRASLPAPHRSGIKIDGERPRHRVSLTLITFCVLLALLYGFDYLVARTRLARNGNALGSVKVEILYAIPQKSGKTEFNYGGSEVQRCLHSLFPHLGYDPCWYAARHAQKQVNY
jgi:hypothetical protein